MASQRDVLKGIAGILKDFDDDAYALLANKGLLRRARKDLEKQRIELLATTESSVEISVGDFRVRLDSAGPAAATCTCVSKSTCQHILSACLGFEKLIPIEQSEELPKEDKIESEDSVSDYWISLDRNSLVKLHGLDTYWKGSKIVAEQKFEVEARSISFQSGVRSLLPNSNSIEGIICDASPKERSKYVIASVLAFQIANGATIAREERSKADQTISEPTLRNAQKLVEEIVDSGLCNLTASSKRRLLTLSVELESSSLHRPALEAEACSKDVSLILDRNALADTTRLFDRLTRLWALCESLISFGEQAPNELKGLARSSYLEIPDLKLLGMGAYPWETDSGYRGLTSLFWSPENRVFYSWSEVRDRNSDPSFSPKSRFDGESPWRGAKSLSELCHSSFTLHSPKTNNLRRLSSHENCRTGESAPIDKGEFPECFANWNALREDIRSKSSIGLQRNSPLDHLRLIKPTEWGEQVFDEIDQAFTWELYDSFGDRIVLSIPFVDMNKQGIEYLESIRTQTTELSLLADFTQIRRDTLFPITLFSPDEAVVPVFLTKPEKATTRRFAGLFGKKSNKKPKNQPLDEKVSSLDERDLLSPLAQFLSELDDLTTTIAETGIQRAIDHTKSGKLAKRIRDAGLHELAKSTEKAFALDRRSARSLIAARHLYLLHIEAAS